MEKELAEFTDQCIYRMEESTRMIKKCLAELTEDEVWKRPNTSTNTIGNLMLHLRGNIRQYAISSLGNTQDNRKRDEEFSHSEKLPKQELLERLTNTVEEARDVVRQASPEEMLRKRKVQGFELSGIGIIVHFTEHYSYHTGQIALLTKLWKNKDLGFYDGVDLNATNQE